MLGPCVTFPLLRFYGHGANPHLLMFEHQAAQVEAWKWAICWCAIPKVGWSLRTTPASSPLDRAAALFFSTHCSGQAFSTSSATSRKTCDLLCRTSRSTTTRCASLASCAMRSISAKSSSTCSSAKGGSREGTPICLTLVAPWSPSGSWATLMVCLEHCQLRVPVFRLVWNI